jgi:hypothetical protein
LARRILVPPEIDIGERLAVRVITVIHLGASRIAARCDEWGSAQQAGTASGGTVDRDGMIGAPHEHGYKHVLRLRRALD